MQPTLRAVSWLIAGSATGLILGASYEASNGPPQVLAWVFCIHLVLAALFAMMAKTL